MEFSASITCMDIANDTYHVCTHVPTPQALCLGTPVPRQKKSG